jgi:nitrite reductase (NADH) large subunit
LLFFTVIGFGQVSFMNSNVAPLNKQQTLVVIGNGMVGHHCVEQLIERGALERYRLHVFSEEPMRAYDRVHLSEYFSGRDAESLALSDAALYQKPGVTLHLGVPVLEIDRARRQVITSQGCITYDKLVMATGSYPFVPPIEGAEGDSRLVYRTLEDLDAIRAAAGNARRGVVVGGGLLGLEAANALKSLGLEAHVVEFAPRLMPVQLDDLGGLALKAQIEAPGRRCASVPRHAIDQRRRAVPLPDEFRQRRIP